jgi:hypothetical protein
VIVWRGCLFECVWWQIVTFCWTAVVDVVAGLVVDVGCGGDVVVVGTLIEVPGAVVGGIVVGTGMVVVTGIVVVTVIVETVPVVVVVVTVTVVVGLTFCADAASFEAPAVTWASPTPAAAANARPTADATTTRERLLTRGNRLAIGGDPFVGD